MKPLCLKIAGLNSFRDVQEIDFEMLCQGGVFGIFGPTGSGKSTILDAITLALFGSVERAAHNTQGILNLTQDTLSVQFRFSLGCGLQRRVFQAERSYKRASDHTVRAAICRLIEIKEDQETVLAGSADELTRQVKQILGLNLDDFTRAVVLPQGKFAEFMSLSPGDRRNMLERLFGLEEYGKNLNAKIKQRLETANQELHGIEKYQLGLGDASEKSVQAAEEALAQAGANVASQEEKLRQFRQAYEEIREIWGLQQEQEATRQKEWELAERRPGILNLEERLAQAERAEKIRTLIVEKAQAEEKVRTSRIQLEQAKRKQAEVQGKYQFAEAQWRNALQIREDNETNLTRRLEQLDQAVIMENDIREKKKLHREIRQRYENKQREKKEIEQKLAALRQEREELRQALETDKARRQEILISPEQRESVTAAQKIMEACEKVSLQAAKLQKELAGCEHKLHEAQSEWTAHQERTAQAKTELAELKEVQQKMRLNRPVDESGLLAEIQEAERCKGIAETIQREEKARAEAEAEIARLAGDQAGVQAKILKLKERQQEIMANLAAIKLKAESARRKVQAHEAENMAAVLVEHLTKGSPCPVCGSLEHPSPASGILRSEIDDARTDLLAREADFKVGEEQLSQCSTQLAVATVNGENGEENLQKQTAILKQKEKSLAQLQSALKSELRELDGKALDIACNEWVAAIEVKRAEGVAWKTALEAIAGRIEEKQIELNRRTAQESKLQAKTESVHAEIKQKRLFLDEQLQDLEITRTRLDEVRGKTEIPEIPVLARQYAAWDQESQKLHERLAKTETELLALDTETEQVQEEKTFAELEMKGLVASLVEANKGIGEWERKLAAVTGGEEAGVLLQEIKSKREEIITAERKTKELFENNRNTADVAAKELAVRNKEWEMFLRQSEHHQKLLAAGLEEADFLTEAMAENALCDADERREMFETIQQYHKMSAVFKEQDEAIRSKLRGRKVEAEVWRSWPERLEKEEELSKQLLSHQAAAKNTLESLRERQMEWARLEKEKKAVSHQADLLNSLQKILQGNAFVEYIAQEQLYNVALDASGRLGKLTAQRYALEIDSTGGFIIRDDGNGGARRPVYSFSGGEKFLASLALALALSTQIQLHGEAPLEFFFLDEGFGSLDKEVLEAVMNTLEKLRLQDLSIGIISHVEEIKSRMTRRLIVTPAETGGAGSRVRLEMA